MLRCALLLVIISSELTCHFSKALSKACSSTTLPTLLTGSSVLNFVNLRVTCGSQYIEARLLDCPLEALGHNATYTLAIANSTVKSITSNNVEERCKPRLKPNNIQAPGKDAVFYINVSDCSPVIFRNSSHLIYNYAIITYLSSVSNVDRGYSFQLLFSCIYVLNLDVSMPFGITYINSTTFTISKLPTASLDLAMGLYTDSTYTSLVAGNITVDIPSYIYVGITFLRGKSNYLVLQATQCWATSAGNRNDVNSYSLLISGCPTTSNVVLYENYYSSQARFALKAFTWNGISASAQVIYIHCKLTVCDTVLSDTCTLKNCIGTSEVINGRRKRSSHIEKSHIVSLGPIKINPNVTLCKWENGGCDHLCTVNLNFRIECICKNNYTLSFDRKTCLGTHNMLPDNTDNTIYFEDLSVPMTEVKIMTLAVILLAICVTALKITTHRYRKLFYRFCNATNRRIPRYKSLNEITE